ncbi:MAG: hypothetical protein Kow00121_45450 [Elainellaceae cyanobacterium]
MNILRAAMLYFALVFGAGFILGIIRVLWLVPYIGTRWAELLEMPIMLAVIILAARWTIRRWATPATKLSCFGIGLIALGLLLTTEFTLVLWLRGLSIPEYFATRDPVAGTAYFIMLGVFAVMPLLMHRSQTADRSGSAHLPQ